MLENIVLFVVVIGIFIAALVHSAKRLGKQKQIADSYKKREKQDKDIREIHNRVATDSSYRNKLHDRFRTKD